MDLMTSQPETEDAENSLELGGVVIIQTPSSAVQDWSLVCQQLCG
ncbi:hypothetical protein EVAR_69143_1, partial [Eumeta japonica]